MFKGMHYRLALDLGSTSLGWAVLRLKDNKPCAIINAGTRIFSDGRNPKDGTSLAVTRRTARAMRRRRDRLLKRKDRLTKALVDLGFFPQDIDERQDLTLLDPYELRAKGLDESLSGAEFARALFHINQRRGFKSNRKTDRSNAENGLMNKAIKQLHEILKAEKCRTIGEWLARRHAKGESVRARLHGTTVKDKAYDFYADRQLTEEEFDALWMTQSTFNPNLFNDNARIKLKDILLFQRPLKPVMPGRCTLLPNEERAPAALPSAQRCRIYQEINNLRLLDTTNYAWQILTIEQRDKLFQLFESKKEVSILAIKKELGLPSTTQTNWDDTERDSFKGNQSNALLSKKDFFGGKWFDYSNEFQDEIVMMLLEEESPSKLVDWLQKRTGIDADAAEKLSNLNLPEGYGNISVAAINKILPFLKKEVSAYSDAVAQAGLGSHSNLTKLEKGEILDHLPYYGEPLQRHVAFGKINPKNDEEKYGKIANPTVHIGLNQVRVVVNDLISRYGHPDQIVLEVARELKLSEKRKKEIEKEQRSNQNRNKEYVKEACQVLGLDVDVIDKSKRRDLSQRMQLWYELNPQDAANRCCPYTGEKISIERLLLSNEVEIEHILPYSRTLDDSMQNKTLCLRRANRVKENKSPYEAFGKQKINGYDYDAIQVRAKALKGKKYIRFLPDAFDQVFGEGKDFLARALNDTAYLSKITKEYLSCICSQDNIWVIPGMMTAKLRGKFGLNQLLSGTEEKNRNDHRHHALDAMVIGITDRSMLQQFARANASAIAKGLDKLTDTIPLPWETYRDHVSRTLHNIVVSHKPDHGYQGAMHEDTAWGLMTEGQVRRHVRVEGALIRSWEIKPLQVIPFFNANKRHGLLDDGTPKPYKGYKGGSNFCIEIWTDENGKWNSDVVSTYEAYQVIKQYGQIEGEKKLKDVNQTLSGKPLVMRLIKNDYVQLDIDNQKISMIVIKFGQNGQMFFAPNCEANVDARNREKTFSYTSKTAGSLQKVNAKKCTVSPSGKLTIIRHK